MSDEVDVQALVASIGEPAARELAGVLSRSQTDRATLIGRLAVRADGDWLAELLAEIENDRDDLVRLRLAAALQGALG